MLHHGCDILPLRYTQQTHRRQRNRHADAKVEIQHKPRHTLTVVMPMCAPACNPLEQEGKQRGNERADWNHELIQCHDEGARRRVDEAGNQREANDTHGDVGGVHGVAGDKDQEIVRGGGGGKQEKTEGDKEIAESEDAMLAEVLGETTEGEGEEDGDENEEGLETDVEGGGFGGGGWVLLGREGGVEKSC